MDNIPNNFAGSSVGDVLSKNKSLKSAENFQITYIPIEQLIPSNKNKYSLTEINTLAASIHDEGLNQPIVVRVYPEDKNKYEIIYGHRRRLAILLNIENGDDRYKKVPCLIKEISDDIDMEITLINGNATTRELSDSDKMHQIARLKELYRIKRERGDAPSGRIRQKIAKDLNMSPTAVGRYETIEKKLIPELKDQFEKGIIKMSTAAELATKSNEEQNAIYENSINNRHIKLADVKKSSTSPEPEKSIPTTSVLQNEEKVSKQPQHEQLLPSEIVRKNKNGEYNTLEDCRVASFLSNHIGTCFNNDDIKFDKVTRFFKDDNLFAVEVIVNNELNTYKFLGDQIIKVPYGFSESVGLVER